MAGAENKKQILTVSIHLSAGVLLKKILEVVAKLMPPVRGMCMKRQTLVHCKSV
jgi:hypothetical protein